MLAIPEFLHGEASGGIFFTNRAARTQFVSELPAYRYGKADRGANTILADRGILGVQGVAYFALSLQIDLLWVENVCKSSLTPEPATPEN